MRKKLNVFNTVLFTLIFCFMLGNCEDISFDKSLVKQIEDDTTCTVRFYVGNPIDVPVGTENPYVDVKYKIGQVITADELPDSNDKRFANLNGSEVIKNWKWVTTSAPLPDDIIKDSDGNIISIRPTGVVIELFGNWVHGCTLTFMDGLYGSTVGKEFSGVSKEPIKFWSGEEVKIPKPVADVSSSENTVEFDGWYTDAGLTNSFSSASLEPDGYYHYPTDSYTTNTTLYAKWKYRYVYVDPRNAADNSKTGIDSTKPLKTIAEAKKYLVNALGDASDPPAVKLMSGIATSGTYAYPDAFVDLKDLTTTTYNYAILSRYPGFKGAFFHNTENTTIENITIDGGKIADCLPIFSTIISTTELKNVVVQNNYTSSDYPSVISDSSAHLTIEDCKFINNKTTASGMNGSVIRTSANATFKNTEIKGNDGNGIAVIVTNDNGYPMLIENCTISGNTGYGIIAEGGDFSNYKTLNITVKDSSKITDNTEGNVKLINKTKDVNLIVYSGVIFDSSKYIELTNGATIQIAEDLTVTSPATYIAKIYSNDYGNNPTVLTGSGTLVADNYTKFACAHSGYGINSDGKIVPIGSISIGIDNPSGFTEIDLGDLAVTQVNLNATGDTVIRFNLNSGVADKLASWGIPGTDPEETAHPIQYVIDSTYGCVQTEYDSGTGKWYADIVIGRKPDDTIPNAFETSDNPYPLTKGLHTLQIYSEAKEANAVVTKKTYNIVVK